MVFLLLSLKTDSPKKQCRWRCSCGGGFFVPFKAGMPNSRAVLWFSRDAKKQKTEGSIFAVLPQLEAMGSLPKNRLAVVYGRQLSGEVEKRFGAGDLTGRFRFSEAAKRVFASIRAAQLQPDTAAMNSLIDSFAKCRAASEALEYLRAMRRGNAGRKKRMRTEVLARNYRVLLCTRLPSGALFRVFSFW